MSGGAVEWRRFTLQVAVQTYNAQPACHSQHLRSRHVKCSQSEKPSGDAACMCANLSVTGAAAEDLVWR